MLREAERFDAEEGGMIRPAFMPVSTAATSGAVALSMPAGRYGEDRRFSLPAIALTILIHAILLAAVLLIRDHIVQKREEKLTVVNLTPPSPPPSPPEQPQTPVPPVAMVPKPLVEIPMQTPLQVVTTPDPVPVTMPPVAATPAPALPSPPAPPRVIDGGDIGAQMISGKDPTYPVESLRKREQGTVVVAVTVGLDGSVVDVSINRSSGFERLDKVVINAVRKWRWRPILRNGQPVMVRGFVEYPFVLRG
jgi:protein TonB